MKTILRALLILSGFYNHFFYYKKGENDGYSKLLGFVEYSFADLKTGVTSRGSLVLIALARWRLKPDIQS